jgi:hypothetical protein
VGKTIGMISLNDLFIEAIEEEFGAVSEDA